MRYILLLIAAVFISACTTLPLFDQGADDNLNEDNMYMVSHSEYWSGEQGQIITRLLNYKGETIIANCSVDIFYPDKSYFAQGDNMSFGVDSYYYSFTTPAIEGVYEYKATCNYNAYTNTRSVMNSFHLSPALNLINQTYEDFSGLLINLTNLENAHFGNISYNLTQIKDDTNYIRSNIQSNVTIITFQNDVLDRLNNISVFCDTNITFDSNLCQWVNETRVRLDNMNRSVDTFLYGINGTVYSTADLAYQINQTVSGLSLFTQADRDKMDAMYNCTIIGVGCYLNEERIWNYSGRYINGETP